MNLVEIVKELAPERPTLMPGEEHLKEPPRRYEVIADFPSVGDALDAIRSDALGDGPFTILTVHRRGVKLEPVSTKRLVTGEAFGSKGPRKAKAPSTGKSKGSKSTSPNPTPPKAA